jgi:outer membrane receptor protein involved in Fe transport
MGFRNLIALFTASALVMPLIAVTDEEEGVVEEIVVTASHRQSTLMESPQSISAITGDMLEEMGVTDMKQVFKNIPGLNMVEGAGTGRNKYIVRGVSSQGGDSSYMQSFSAISVFVDEVNMTSAQGGGKNFGGNMFDLERVEVLKGPQGTLFGEGAVGGSIRFIQNKPQLDTTDWKLKMGYDKRSDSDDNGHRVDAMVNVPLGDSAALRAVIFDTGAAGYVDRTIAPVLDDQNSESSQGGRLSVLWVNDALSIQGTYYTSSSETEGNFMGDKLYEDSLNYRLPGLVPIMEEEIDIFSLDVDYEFDFATLELTASNMERESYRMGEFPAGVAAFYDWFIQFNVLTRAADRPDEIPTMLAEGWTFDLADTAGGPNQTGFNVDDMASSDRSTFGARLVSSGDSNIEWLAGVFIKDSDDYRRNVQPQDYRPHLADATFTKSVYNVFYSDPSNTHEDTLDEKSVFGEFTYSLNEAWDLTLGLRYTDMEQMIDDGRGTTEDKIWSPKFTLAWQATDETLAYFNISTGFRPGNINLGQEFNVRQLGAAGDEVIPSTPFAGNPLELTGTEAAALAESRMTYEGDSVTNYELGLKTRLADNRVQLTGSLYYFDWEDTILLFADQNIPSINRNYMDNAGAAHSQGVEVGVDWQVTDFLSLNIGADINEAELDEAVGGSPAGTRLPNAPEWSWSAMVDYGIPLDGGREVNFTLNYSAMGSQESSLGIENTDGAVVSSFTYPRRHSTDLSAHMRGENDRWKASLFVKNLTGEESETYYVNVLAVNQYAWQPPRQIGLEFTIRAQ